MSACSTFVHLQLHSEYSLLDSTVRIKPLIEAVVAGNMPAVAITDQSNLFALIKFLNAAEPLGIKPIVGSDIWIKNEEDLDSPYQLSLLCQNHQGFLNLSKILSLGYQKGQHQGRPLIEREWLLPYTEGLIALSGGMAGDIGHALLINKEERSERLLEEWLSVFPGRYYLSVSRTGKKNEEDYLESALYLAAKYDCPIVASNDVRFLLPTDYDAHDARVCIHQGRTLDDPRRAKDYTDQQYLKSAEEMALLFDDIPGAIENTSEIAKRCNLEMKLGTYYLPAFPVAEGATIESTLQLESEQGLKSRLEKFGCSDHNTSDDYYNRLKHELAVIVEMGFPGYFLIVADFIRWAKSEGIPVGPGRGSGAGSVVAWVLGITDLDPLRYDLLFERFLNPERLSMPDFDVDFCMEKRDLVIDYVARKYGRDHVAQIITYGSMAAKAVVRDAGRVLGHPYGMVDRIAKQVPMELGITLQKALAEAGELQDSYNNDEEARGLLDLAKELEGLIRNTGKHAGGVVISPTPLTDFSPLYCEEDGSNVVTQFDKDDVESAGLVKFDFLGLKTLTVIDWAVESINQELRQSGFDELDIIAIDTDDPKCFTLLKACNTTAVFQLESRGMKELIGRLQPDSFEDIIALVALYRPGPLQSGMVDDFIDRKHGRAKVVYPHDSLEPVLKPTYGVILYQEQVMQIAQVLALYSLGGADVLRRAMGKKKPEEMAKQRGIFIKGAADNQVDQQLADAIFDLMEKFAGYGFNKSHSAAYALIAYQTAYLKAYYPAHFLAAVLSADMDNTDKVVVFIDDAKENKLTILPPDINSSNFHFQAQNERTIVYGLGAVKGVGQAGVEAIAHERIEHGSYQDIYDFCTRVDLHKVNKRAIEQLIRAGALDALGDNRASLMHYLPDALRAAEQESKNREAGQFDMFGSPAAAKSSSVRERIDDWSDDYRLNVERETLGFYLTGHPINRFLPELDLLCSCRLKYIDKHYRKDSPSPGQGKSKRRNPGQTFILSGMVSNVRQREGRMAFLTLDDNSGRIDVAVFDEAFRLYSDLLVKDALIVIEGGVSQDDYSGGYKLLANSIFSLDGARAHYARLIEIYVKAELASVHELTELLALYQGGSCPLVFCLESQFAKGKFRSGDHWRLKPYQELIDKMKELPEISKILIKYSKGASLCL